MADKKYTLGFKSGEIVHMGMHKSKSGYNYASVGIKRGKDQFMSISYEWEGERLPDFVMDIMTYFNSEEKKEKASADNHEEVQADFEAFLERLSEGVNIT